MDLIYYTRGVLASGTSVSVSGSIVEVSGDIVLISGQSVYAYISGGSITASVSGQAVYAYISGGDITASVSGQSVFVYVSGGSITASISGQVVYVGENYIIQRDMGSSLSVSVSTSYIAQKPLVVDAVNLNIATLPPSVSGGVLTVDINTSSAVFPFVRDAFVYYTSKQQTAKSICYYPDPQLCVASGDIVNVKYNNNTSECAEARIEIILRSVE